MKKSKLLAMLPLVFMVAACGKKKAQENPTKAPEVITTESDTKPADDKTSDIRYQIYLSAVSSGYDGDYDAWLNSIRGDEIELRISDGYIQKKYSSERRWTNLIALDDLAGDTIEPSFRVENSYIQYKNSNQNEWTNLLSLNDLNCKDGENAIMQVSNGYIQWKNTSETSWHDLVEIESLVGDNGEDGKEIVISVENDYIVWKYEGETSWNNLIDIDSLKGADGSSKRNDMQVADGYIQWKYEDETTWHNLISLTTITGPAGDQIELREHEGYVQWKYTSSTDWTNLYPITNPIQQFTVQFDLNGGTGEIASQTISKGDKVEKPSDPTNKGQDFLGWYYKGEKWSFIGYPVTENMTLTARWEAEYDAEIESYEYTEKDGFYTITGIKDGCRNSSMVIPSNVTKITFDEWSSFDSENCINNIYYNGSISDWCNIIFESQKNNPMNKYYGYGANWFYILDENGSYEYNGKNYSLISTLVIPDTVTSIGDNQFFCFSQLHQLVLSNNTTFIGSDAFNGCNNLDIIFYNGSLDDWCDITFENFASCPTNIKTGYTTDLYLLDSTGSLIYDGKTYKLLQGSVVLSNNVTKLGDFQFAGNGNITSVTIPSSVTSIGINPFVDCKNIESIIVDSNNNVFDSRNNCNAIIKTSTNSLISSCNNTTIPSGITRIEAEAFNGNDSITSIILPEGLTSIGSYALCCCNNLEEITLPGTLISIEEGAFTSCTKLTSITLPEGLTSIGAYAFSNTGIVSINLPNGLEELGNGAFNSCQSLTKITIPSGITIIGDNMFVYCNNLEKVVLSSSTTSIGIGAFYGCSKLESIIIPSTVTYLGPSVLYGCSSLIKVYYEGSYDSWWAIDGHSEINNYIDKNQIYYYSDTTPTDPYNNYWHYVNNVVTEW